MLDLGTGGGEWLADLPARAPHTVATEAWEPNVSVAKARLGPLGIDVVRVEGAPDNASQGAGEPGGALPFEDCSFDLVTSRHESFVASEVARVLRLGGVFVTQQLGDGVFSEFYEVLGAEAPRERRWRLALAVDQVERVGLTVTRSAEGEQEVTFADVGALAWYLRMTPWTVRDFSIDRYRARLRRLHEEIRAQGPIAVALPGFLLEAVKEGAAQPKRPVT